MSFFSISPCCLKGTVLPGEPRGVYQPVSLADKRTAGRYYTTPQDGVKHPKVAILLYMDLLGLSIPNGKILADLLADKLGVAVYAPDYIPSPPKPESIDPVLPSFPGEHAAKGRLQVIREWASAIPRIIAAMYNNRASLILPTCRNAIADLKLEGYEKIGAIGYCRGGGMILNLMGEGLALDCAVIAHSSPESLKLAQGIKKPLQIHCAGEDGFFTPAIGAQWRDAVSKNGVEAELSVWPDTTHGYACRPALTHEPTKKAFNETHEQAVAFFTKHLLA